MDNQTFITSLIQQKIVPGITLLMARGDTPFIDTYYGNKSLVPEPQPLHQNTLYDLASLTKPLVTAFLTLYLKDQGTLSLDMPVAKVFPKLKHLQGVHIRHLLTHTSGLPAWYPFFLWGKDYLSQFPNVSLISKPGRRVEYSCLGYILLYYIIEKVSGESFVPMAHQVIFEPLNLKHTFFQVPDDMRTMAAHTELGSIDEQRKTKRWLKKNKKEKYWQLHQNFQWRDYLIQGETHDLLSYFHGGTAGNAGLFSTSSDIFQMCLQFYPESATILSPETLELCWTNFTPFKKSHRTIGFKRNSSLFTSGGRAFSRSAIGHNGFTGTSIWLDRNPKERKPITAIMLTNIIHPAVKPHHFDRARRKIHALAIRAL